MPESSTRDVGLLDLAAGYFGYLDYATNSAVAFLFVRDFGNLARLVATKAKFPSSGIDQRRLSALGNGTSIPEFTLQSNAHPNHGYALQSYANVNSAYHVGYPLLNDPFIVTNVNSHLGGDLCFQ